MVVAALLEIKIAPPQQDGDEDDREEQPPDALTWRRMPECANGNANPPLLTSVKLPRCSWYLWGMNEEMVGDE